MTVFLLLAAIVAGATAFLARAWLQLRSAELRRNPNFFPQSAASG